VSIRIAVRIHTLQARRDEVRRELADLYRADRNDPEMSRRWGDAIRRLHYIDQAAHGLTGCWCGQPWRCERGMPQGYRAGQKLR
jgi:hypothetical protein